MRVLVLCAIMFLSAGCLAQSGSDVIAPIPDSYMNGAPLPGPGMYAMPFIPLVETPTMELSKPPVLTGARNSTGDNVAGAQNGTMSTLPQRVDPLLIAPQSAEAPVSYDIYPRAGSGRSD